MIIKIAAIVEIDIKSTSYCLKNDYKINDKKFILTFSNLIYIFTNLYIFTLAENCLSSECWYWDEESAQCLIRDDADGTCFDLV